MDRISSNTNKGQEIHHIWSLRQFLSVLLHAPWRYNRLPVSRGIRRIIQDGNLKETFTYMDDTKMCGAREEEYDFDLEGLHAAARKYELTLIRRLGS